MVKKTANQLFHTIVTRNPTVEESMDELATDLLKIRKEIEEIDPKFHVISVDHAVHFDGDQVVVTAAVVSSNELVPVNR